MLLSLTLSSSSPSSYLKVKQNKHMRTLCCKELQVSLDVVTSSSSEEESMITTLSSEFVSGDG